jgi:hypothetical protein
MGAGYPITTPHSRNPLVVVGGDQLQPGEEDGGIPTEVVAKEKQENPKNKKTRNPPKRRALSTRERGQQKHQQLGRSNFYDCQIGSSIKNRPGEKYQEDQGLLFVAIHWDTLIYMKTTNQDNKYN